jgi:Xaa-Pro dipeptidase
LRRVPCAPFGIEASGISARTYTRLAQLPLRTELVDVSDALDEVRLVCSDEEIAYLREASRIADVGMAEILNRIGIGADEREFCLEARLAMEQSIQADQTGAANVYLQQGESSIVSHGRPGSRAIRDGSLVEIVCECELFYYQVAVERCVLVGDVAPKVERAYRVMLEAFEAAKAATRPGMSFADVHEQAARVFQAAGYGDYGNSGLIRNVTHHWTGRLDSGNHRAYNHRLLEPGMVLTIEPCAFVVGVGAPRHCDVVLVRVDGHEVMTAVEGDLIRR